MRAHLRLCIVLVLAAVVAAPAAAGPGDPPATQPAAKPGPADWAWSVRALSMSTPVKPDEGALKRIAAALQTRGVNTILDGDTRWVVRNSRSGDEPPEPPVVPARSVDVFTRAMRASGLRVIRGDSPAGVPLLFEVVSAGVGPGLRWGGTGFLGATLWPACYGEMAMHNAAAEAKGAAVLTRAHPNTFQVDDSEQFFCWAQASLMGQRYCMRESQAEPQWYEWEAKFEDDLIHPRRIGDVGLFYPAASARFGQVTSAAYTDWAGWGEALASHAVMCDGLAPWHLENDKLDRFRVIIVPSERVLSDAMVEHLEAFVRRGGWLIITADAGVGDAGDPGSGAGSNDVSERVASLAGFHRMAWSSESAVARVGVGGLVAAGDYVFMNGHQRVRPLEDTRVVGSIVAGPAQPAPAPASTGPATATQPAPIFGGIPGDPAILIHPLGSGAVIYFAGRVGAPAWQFHSDDQPRLPTFFRTADQGQRTRLAQTVTRLLGNRPRVEVQGLPDDVMCNAFETLGRGIDDPRLTIHFLDCSPAIKSGDPWPDKPTPLAFTPIGVRARDRSILIVLRGLAGIEKVQLISPDFVLPRTLRAHGDEALGGQVVTLPSAWMGRYSVVVVTPGKR